MTNTFIPTKALRKSGTEWKPPGSAATPRSYPLSQRSLPAAVAVATAAGDPVNLAPLQLGKKSSRIHDNGGNITATRFSCTKRDTRLRTRPEHPLCSNDAANIAGALGFHQNRVVGFPRPTRKKPRGLPP